MCLRIGPDLAVGYPFPVVLTLRAMGWAEDGAPGIEEVLADIASPGSA
jgi:hypothetical protein